MKRVLLVDDDRYVLNGLNRLLRKERGRIETVLAESGAEGLARLAETRFDIVISDMKMPLMDGAEFLAHVQVQQPSAIRIVLSGHAEMEAAMRAVPFAHQFLAKPFEGEALKELLDRALDLAELLGNDALQRAVGAINSLPAIPQVYDELRDALERADVRIEDIHKIMLKDSALCAKILQIVNSSFFGLSRRVSNLRDAINLLGIPMLKNLVLYGLVFEALDEVDSYGDEDGRLERIHDEQKHSLLAAYLCQAMFLPQNSRDDAFMAGLMHNIGTRVVLSCAPRRAQPDPLDLSSVETSGSRSDSRVGAYLLGIWGVPADIVDAIASQESPEAAEGELTLSEALHLADHIARGALDTEGPPLQISEERIQALGLEERIQEWTSWAEELAWTMTTSC